MAVRNNLMVGDNYIEDAVIRDVPGEQQEDLVIEDVSGKSSSDTYSEASDKHSIFRVFLPARVLSVFCSQWSIIIHSGASSLNALKIVKEQTESRRLKRALGEMIKKIGMGIPVAETMAATDLFPEDFVKCVELADETGKLEDCLKRYADVFDQREKQRSIRTNMAGRPAMLLLISLVLILTLLAIIYPKFMGMFEGTGIEISGLTSVILKISMFIKNYWHIIILVIVAIYVAVKLYFMTDAGRSVGSRLSLSGPISGVVKKKHVLSDVARSLGVMLSQGYDTPEALRVLSQTYGDEEYIRVYLGKASVNIQSGITLSHALSDAGFFPAVFTQMLSVGEEMGNVVEMLFDIADYYDNEAKRNAERCVAVLEPVILIAMAVVLFIIIISLTSPVTALYEYVRNL